MTVRVHLVHVIACEGHTGMRHSGHSMHMKFVEGAARHLLSPV